MAKETNNHIGKWKTSALGHLSKDTNGDEKTDYSRWRLEDKQGTQIWRYLESDEENKTWPQSVYEKHFLGLDTGLPDVSPAKTPLDAAKNGLEYYKNLQLPSGQWAAESSGPLLMLPVVVISCYVTNTPIPPAHAVEIKRYLFSQQHLVEGGWGWHVEAKSSNIGTALNYVTLRLLGASKDDPRLAKARKFLHSVGGAIYGPSVSKHFLSVLGVMEWSCVSPFLPEVWLLPDTDPTAPMNWYVHTRTNYLPMSYLWSKKWTYTPDALTTEIRSELYTKPYETVNFSGHRDSIADTDNNWPKSWLVHFMNFLMVWLWLPIRWSSLIKRAEDRVYELMQADDKNTDSIGLSPISNALQLVVCYSHDGENSESVRIHREKILAYFWMKEEGMLCNLCEGTQSWDTAMSIQAVGAAGLAGDPKYRTTLTKAQEFLEYHQVTTNVENQENCYREPRKGGWAFGTKYHGYIISECTAEGLRSILQLQELHKFPKLISAERLQDSVDCLLRLQNDTGGFCIYEKRRCSPKLELLDAAEFSGKSMVSYDYVECTTSVITSLFWFQKFYPKYRTNEIEAVKHKGLSFIRQSQQKDGGWPGTWGICFSYGAMWALETLALNGEYYSTSDYSRRGCEFLLSLQREDGGWGESYLSAEQKTYIAEKESQVVQTAWACLALMEANYPNKEPITKGIKLVMSRQQAKGQWLQEALEGSTDLIRVFSHPNYKIIWPVRAFGQYIQRYGNEELH
ncbi:oxidosqualene:lanosterol cyclase [Bisporella sp. PMI_857]|nr:oxidosqualene:lanosterol cyclase [Bisporella sp. PMI_857]